MLEAEEIFDDASRHCDLDAVFIVCVDERDHTNVVVWIEDNFSQAPWNSAAVEYHLIVTRTESRQPPTSAPVTVSNPHRDPGMKTSSSPSHILRWK